VERGGGKQIRNPKRISKGADKAHDHIMKLTGRRAPSNWGDWLRETKCRTQRRRAAQINGWGVSLGRRASAYRIDSRWYSAHGDVEEEKDANFSGDLIMRKTERARQY